MKHLVDGKVKIDNLSCVSISNEEQEKFCLKKGDILLNRTNSYELVGKVSLFESDNKLIVFASYLVRFQFDKNKVLPEFANYFLNSYPAQHYLKRLATKGVSQANINPSIFRKLFLLPIPPLEEQKKIAEILSTWDKAIALTEKLIAAKQKLKKSLKEKLLTGNFRFSKYQNQEWKLVALKKCSIFVKDGTHGTHKRIKNGVPLLSAANISNNGEIILDSKTSYISEQEYNKIHAKYELNPNDLLVTVVGTLGRTALIKKQKRGLMQKLLTGEWRVNTETVIETEN